MSNDDEPNPGMFWYAIHLFPDGNTPDDWRFTEDRGMARVAMTILGLEVRVAAKPLKEADHA